LKNSECQVVPLSDDIWENCKWYVNGVYLSMNSDYQMHMDLVPRIILSTLIDGLQHCDGYCINYPSMTKNKRDKHCVDYCISAIPQPTFLIENFKI
jgi:hypothetical protein